MADLAEAERLAAVDVVEVSHPGVGDLAVIVSLSPFEDDTFAAPAGYVVHAVDRHAGGRRAVASKVVVDVGWVPSVVVAGWARAGTVEVRPRFFRRR